MVGDVDYLRRGRGSSTCYDKKSYLVGGVYDLVLKHGTQQGANCSSPSWVNVVMCCHVSLNLYCIQAGIVYLKT